MQYSAMDTVSTVDHSLRMVGKVGESNGSVVALLTSNRAKEVELNQQGLIQPLLKFMV